MKSDMSAVHSQMQECLQEDYENFWIMAHRAPWGLSVMNPDLSFEYVNPEFKRIFGYTIDDVPDKNVWFAKAYPDPAYRHMVHSIWKNDLAELRRTDTQIARTFTVRCKNGEDRIVRMKNLALREGRHFLAYEDLTERLRFERKLEEDKKWYQTIFESSGDAVFIMTESAVVECNERTLELFGCESYEEIVGHSPWSFSPASQPDGSLSRRKARRYIQAALQGKAARYHWKFRRKEGTLFDAEISMSRIIVGEQAYLLAAVRDVSKQKEYERKLRHLSFHDLLTGLNNRNYFEQEMKRLEQEGESDIGVIVTDVDGLKFVNDALGHDSGDRLLRSVASILRRTFRSRDIIARIGGDEFAVLMPEAEEEEVEKAVQSFRDAVDAYNAGNPHLPMTVSVGCAVHKAGRLDLQELYKEADSHIYREKLNRSESTQDYIVQTLMNALRMRDFQDQDHSERLKKMAVHIARKMGASEGVLNNLRLLAQFHDLGKVGIPEHILCKQGPLSPEERTIMREHCEIGHRIAKTMPLLQHIAELILKHHEWWNGQGYPLGLSGEDIPYECRIMAVADAFEAMIAERPYRAPMGFEEALAELQKGAGTQFDPRVVEQFVRIVREKEKRAG
jgi:diguanylate cyclase (GGDEF)-like protein/PAS domain S-box-containing protein